MIIGEMQDKLARWSTENKERKFDRLLRLITGRDWLAEAARVTLASGGARTAGIDGIDKQRMEIDLPAELSRIRTELLAGTYEPLPARRVYIPKASDKKKLRPLGIPSLRDRIVERAMLMAMQPIWEAIFIGFPTASDPNAASTMRYERSSCSCRTEMKRACLVAGLLKATLPATSIASIIGC